MVYEISNLRRKIVLGTVLFGCQYGMNILGWPNALEEVINSGFSTLDTSCAYGNVKEGLVKCRADSGWYYGIGIFLRLKSI